MTDCLLRGFMVCIWRTNYSQARAAPLKIDVHRQILDASGDSKKASAFINQRGMNPGAARADSAQRHPLPVMPVRFNNDVAWLGYSLYSPYVRTRDLAADMPRP